MTRSRFRLATVALPLAALALAACGDDESTDATAAPVTTVAPADTAAPATAAPDTAAPDTAAPDTTGGDGYGDGAGSATPAGAVSVKLADSAFGQILVDNEGHTLYLFTPDTPDTSMCSGDCAANWPPLLVDGAATGGDGIDASLLTMIEAADGAGMQAAYNGHPLYYFAGDAAPGDTNGQKVGDKWFVVDATGNAVTG